MNKFLSMIRDVVQTRAWTDFKRPAIISSIFLLVSVFTYLIILHPQFVSWVLARAEESQSKKSYEKYKNFGELIKTIMQQGDEAAEIGSSSVSEDVYAEKSEERFFELLNACADQAGVTLTKTAPVVLDGDRRGMAVAFTASFSQLNYFLLLVERSCIVDGLTVTGGRTTSRHKVELTVVDIMKEADVTAVRNAVIDRFGGEDIFVLSAEVERLLKTIGRRREIINAYVPPSKDIFLYADTLYVPVQPSGRKVPVSPPVERPKVKIDAIYYDAQAPVVVIDGKAMKPGDTFGEITIVDIREKSIVVKFRGKNHTLEK